MKIPRRRFLHLTAGSAALWAIFGIAKAQTYPSRPIRLVVPFPPGGAFDTLARPWVEKMKPLLGTIRHYDRHRRGSPFANQIRRPADCAFAMATLG